MKEELKENIINNYELFYVENEEELKEKNIFEIISLFVSGLYWDLLDNLEIEKEQFEINQSLTDAEAIIEIEDIITKTLIESEVK